MPSWAHSSVKVLPMVDAVMSPLRLFSTLRNLWSVKAGILTRRLLAGLLMLNVVGAVLQASAQDASTQTISVSQGWNLVSLNVQPDDPSLDAIFGDHLEQIYMVKDEAGKIYVPAENINQITAWETDESYLIYAQAGFDLALSGTSLDPASTPVALRDGWNFIPYLPPAPQSTGQALSSIQESVLRVENRSGSWYEPGESGSTLDSLRPGQGYKLYANESDTLLYPEGQDTIVVNTIAEALGLQGLNSGQLVQIRGYHEAGDGGGGLFEVTTSDCETDGGTCFVFDEDVSAEQVETFGGSPPLDLAHTDVVFNSIHVRFGSDPGDEIGIDLLHGHSVETTSTNWVNLKNGVVNNGRLFPLRNDVGDGNTFQVRYKYATTNRRLERMGVTNTVDLEWWGPFPADPQNPTDQTWALNWAINKAAQLKAENGLDWAYVDVHDLYYRNYTTRLLDGVMIRGDGPLRSDGYTRGGFKVLPGEAMYYKHQDYDSSTDPRFAAGMNKMIFTPGYMATKIGMQKLTLDGNIEANMQVFNSGEYVDVNNWLQNAGAWNAIFTSASGNLEHAPGMEAHMDNLNIQGHGGNGFAMSEGDFELQNSTNVHIGETFGNHKTYALGGSTQDWTITKGGWAALLKMGSKAGFPLTHTNLTVRDLSPTQRGWSHIFNAMDGTGPVTVDPFTIDLRNSTNDRQTWVWKSDKAGGLTMRNGTIHSFTDRALYLWSPRYVVGVPSHNTPNVFEDITVIDEGGGVQLFDQHHATNTGVSIKNLTVQTAAGVTGSYGSHLWGLDIRANRYHRIDIDGFTYERNLASEPFMVQQRYDNEPGAYEVFLRNATLPNAWGRLIRVVEHGAVNEWAGAWKRSVRHYFDNVTMQVPTGLSNDTFHNFLGAEAPVRLRGCQDKTGRVSDAVGQSYTATADDAANGYALIPTSLMSRPGETSVSADAAYNVTTVEIANSDGTLRPDSTPNEHDPYLKVSVDGSITEGDTFTWTARVTPLDEYQTTGVFVSRPVFNKSYTTGTGPWTIDLRGVAASQESRETITYTASSNDTGVVTASVDADGYTLNLTEVGTGTATITVTGTIEGIGTATDTFEVVVEQ
jgi:hypothetical protein